MPFLRDLLTVIGHRTIKCALDDIISNPEDPLTVTDFMRSNDTLHPFKGMKMALAVEQWFGTEVL